MNLKKIMALVTALAVIASLCGCGGILKDETPSEATEVLEIIE